MWISVADAPLWKTLNQHSSVSRASRVAFGFIQDAPTVAAAGWCITLFEFAHRKRSLLVTLCQTFVPNSSLR